MSRAAWLCAALAAACRAHPDAPAVIDLAPALEPIRAREHLPALGAAVWQHGKLVARGITGVRKHGDPTPATIDDRWHLGSDTKAMTATLIGIHVDRGELHWDDPIEKLFPGAAIDPGYARVTLDQLLQHRGGAPASPPFALRIAMRNSRGDPDARTKLVTAVLASPPAQSPGTYVYSNLGYVIAGAALERVTGKRWEQLIRDELFAPLHMDSCGFGPPGDASKLDQPWGHHVYGTFATDEPQLDPRSPADPSADNPPAIGPAGTVHCSLADWGKFLAIHAAPAQTLVSAATMVHLHTAPMIDREHYMAGWIVVDRGAGDIRYAHEGSNTLWHAIALVVPARDEAIAVVANCADDGLFTAIEPVLAPYLR